MAVVTKERRNEKNRKYLRENENGALIISL